MTKAHQKKIENATKEDVQDYTKRGVFINDAIKKVIAEYQKALKTKSQIPEYYREYRYAISYLKKTIIKKSNTMATKKAGLKKPTVKGLKKICSSVVKATGLKADGTLKKGYKYITGGKIVKVTAKPTVKKKVVKKKPVAKKRAVKKTKK